MTTIDCHLCIYSMTPILHKNEMPDEQVNSLFKSIKYILFFRKEMNIMQKKLEITFSCYSIIQHNFSEILKNNKSVNICIFPRFYQISSSL